MARRRTLLTGLALGLAGCTGPRSDETEPESTTEPRTESPTEPRTGTGTGTGSPAESLPAVPTPGPDALERYCGGVTGVDDTALTVLGEALGADENTARVGFTGDGDLAGGPEVVVAGVVAGADVGEHAYLDSVGLADGTLTVAIEEGYPTETGTETAYGMAMGVRYLARVATDGGFPDAVVVRHHGEVVTEVEPPC